jgi:hypothetical protein
VIDVHRLVRDQPRAVVVGVVVDRPPPEEPVWPSSSSWSAVLIGALEEVLAEVLAEVADEELDVVALSVGVGVGVGVGVAVTVGVELGDGLATGASECWTTASAGLRGARWAEVLGALGATA